MGKKTTRAFSQVKEGEKKRGHPKKGTLPKIVKPLKRKGPSGGQKEVQPNHKK